MNATTQEPLAQALAFIAEVRANGPTAIPPNKVPTDPAVIATLAAMVDDTRRPSQLLEWTTRRLRATDDVAEWRRNLTDGECRRFRAALARGDHSEATRHGSLEYWKRRKRSQRPTVEPISISRLVLTDRQCRTYHTAYAGGARDQATLDGEREYHRRRANRNSSQRDAPTPAIPNRRGC